MISAAAPDANPLASFFSLPPGTKRAERMPQPLIVASLELGIAGSNGVPLASNGHFHQERGMI
jgi:hypothetical protein